VGLCLAALLWFLSPLRSLTTSISKESGTDSYLHIIQMMDVTFANIPTEWCENDPLILPNSSDEGENGSWSPSRIIDVDGLGGSTLTVTFTPNNATLNAISFDINIESPPYLGINQSEPLMFCKTGGDIFVDLIDTLDLQLSNIMTLQGDDQLFSFISENSFNPSTFETELRTLNLKNIPSGPYTFFVESGALNSCLFTTKSFSLEVLDVIAGENDTLNICVGNQRFHDFDELINANNSGLWEERSGSNSGVNIFSPSSVDLSTTPIGSYTFDYITTGIGPCSGFTDTASLIVNIQDNSEVQLTDASVTLCGKDNFNQINVTLNGRAPYDFVVQLRDDQDNLFPSYTVSTDQSSYTFQVTHTTGTTRIENGTLYLNQSSSFYDLIPISLQDANSDQCFEQKLTGSTRINFNFVELNINRSICATGEFTFLGETFSAARPFGSVVKQGICDTTYHINLTFDEIPVIPVTEEICENENIILFGEEFSANNLSSQVQISSSDGCDTIYDVTITLRDSKVSILDLELCPGEFVEIGNTTYDINNAIGVEAFTSSNGCDSIVNVSVTAKPPVYAEISNVNCEGYLEQVLCEGDTVLVEDEVFHIGRPAGVVTLVNFDGCDSIININLVYSSPVTEDYSESLCETDIRNIGGTEFNINNPSGTVVLTGANGCDSIIHVDLTYGQSSSVNLTESICDGESFDFGNNIVLNASNTSFTENLTTPEGCDSIINYSVTINPTYSANINESICDGDSRTIGGQTFDSNNSSGIVNLSSVDGCDSIIIVDLTILSNSTNLIQESLCGDAEVLVGNVTFDKNNLSGEVILSNSAGCDSIITVDLEINEISETNVNESICEGETFNFGHGITLGSNNLSESIILLSSEGCDSTVTYAVDILPTYDNSFTETICEGDSRTIGNITFDINNPSGVVNLTTSSGCDSIINVDLVVNPISESLIQQSYCGLEEITIGSEIFNEANPSGTVILTNSNGCDSVVTVDLSFGREINTDFVEEICEGESFDFGNGIVLDQNNSSVTRNLVTTLGCDSIVTHSVIVNAPSVFDYYPTICEGSSIEIEGLVFNASRMSHTFNLINSKGCDSTLNVNLVISPRSQTTIDTVLCMGQSIMVAGQEHTSNFSGTIRLFGQNHMGCDSFIHISLAFYDLIPGPDVIQSICSDDEVLVGNEVFNKDRLSGQVIINNPLSCDTLINVDLTLTPDRSSTITDIICKGSSVTINGDIYDENNLNGSKILTASNGCDSTVIVNLSVQPDITSDINQTICKGSTITINGTNYDQNNLNGFSVLSTADGCDSTVFVNLTLQPDITSDINQTICKGSTVTINGTNYDQNNLNGFSVLSTADGCDSTVFVNLTLQEDITTDINQTICKGSTVTINGTDYDQNNLSGFSVLSTADGCDSTVFVNLSLLEDITSSRSEIICEGDFMDIHGERFDADRLSGEIILSTSAGCDSTVYVNIEMAQNYLIELDTSICASEFGTGINSSDIIRDTFEMQTVNGCDSLFVLNIQVLQSSSSSYEATLCADEFVDIGNERFDINSPVGTAILVSHLGCDSIVNVDLTYITATEETITSTLCEGEEIIVNNISYNFDNPTGLEIISLENGCDSIIVVDLAFKTNSTTLFDDILCENESITVNGVIYDIDTPRGSQLLPSANGCDSIIEVDLTFSIPEDFVIAENLCKGEDLLVEGRRFDYNNPSGNIVLQNAIGCDSIITVNLSFTDIDLDIDGMSVCPDDPAGGRILISGIYNGLEPYSYLLNGSPGEIIHEFPMEISNLNPGNYEIEIMDAEGCTNKRTITVEDAQRMDLNIDYVEAAEGVYDLELEHTGIIDSFYWVSQAELSCYDCMQPSATLEETSIISAVVFDENGCSRQVDVKIEYQRSVKTEVANIINSNSNVGNNMLYLTLEDATNLTYDLLIFSRWGEIIFKAKNMEPNNPNMGWDGTRAGRKLNTGVYIYEMIIKENNVLLEVLHGDVTLID